MIRYQPEAPPINGTPQQIAEWQARENQRIAAAIHDSHTLPVLHAEPAKREDGMYRHADGENWNPGAGKGAYRYNAEGDYWVPWEGGGSGMLIGYALDSLDAAMQFFGDGDYFPLTVADLTYTKKSPTSVIRLAWSVTPEFVFPGTPDLTPYWYGRDAFEAQFKVDSATFQHPEVFDGGDSMMTFRVAEGLTAGEHRFRGVMNLDASNGHPSSPREVKYSTFELMEIEP